jgi:glutamate carboxypeptidase
MTHTASVQQFLNSQIPAALDLLREMVAINSFTSNRDGVNRLGRFTADCFASFGFTAAFVPCANPAWGDHLVMCRRGKSARNIVLISHLDTVFPPEEEIRNQFHWQVEGDRIFGPGTNDIKGGTVMMWLVLSALRSQVPDLFKDLTWTLLWNSSEERFSNDFAQLCRGRFDSGTLAALVFECEGRAGMEPLLVVARKGWAAWRVTVAGRSSHAGVKHDRGANAIVQMAHTVQRIAALTDYARDLTFNVGTICGGTGLNRVPHEAAVEGEFRAFSPGVYAQAKAAFLALAGQGAVTSPVDGYACSVRTEILSERTPWPRNAGTERLFNIWRQAGTELGMAVGSQERGGLSDGNLIWDAVPTLDGLGPWGDNDHCSERSPDGSKLPEFVSLSSFVPKATLNSLAILKLAGQQ